MRKTLGILVLLAVVTLGACGSTATTPKATPKATSAPTPTTAKPTPTTVAAPKPTTPPTTAAPKTGSAAVKWVDSNPSVVTSTCKATADALASGYVTNAQVAKAEVDGWNGSNSGLDGASVMGVIATRCDPKTGAALLDGLTQLR